MSLILPPDICRGTSRFLPRYFHSVYLNIGKKIRSNTLSSTGLTQKMHFLNKNHRRHMYIKISPMQDLPIYCYRYGHLENVKALIVKVPPTKVLSSSADSFSSANPPGCGLGRTGELFLYTCLLEKIMKCIFQINHFYE